MRLIPLVALVSASMLVSFLPTSAEPTDAVPSPPAAASTTACADLDFEERKESPQLQVIGLSSQQVHHEFTLKLASPCDARIWAEWGQPYLTIQFRLLDDDGTLYQKSWQSSLGDTHEKDLRLEPGDYKLELRVFGAHTYQNFGIGADFTDP